MPALITPSMVTRLIGRRMRASRSFPTARLSTAAAKPDASFRRGTRYGGSLHTPRRACGRAGLTGAGPALAQSGAFADAPERRRSERRWCERLSPGAPQGVATKRRSRTELPTARVKSRRLIRGVSWASPRSRGWRHRAARDARLDPFGRRSLTRECALPSCSRASSDGFASLRLTRAARDGRFVGVGTRSVPS